MAVKRIGVVEDHSSVVLGLEVMLARHPGLVVSASAPTVPELLAQRPELDLVLLDLRLADGSSPTVNVEQLRSAGHEALVFTGAENPHLVRLAAKAGVLGVLRKSAPEEVVVEAIAAASQGCQVVTTEWAAAIDGDPDLSDAGLSPRQQEVLALYASGEKAERVARLTGLSPHTVNEYVGKIRAKYAAAGRPAETKVELFKRAVEDGYLPVPQHQSR
ncbi:response regulator transcription factor [Dietzia cercidiphylli]|uniref:response regulator transcription factor n=1 Tax=Dietzia cercidiphylli TaxID=498199 RepID=UPI00223B4090|nr:LuxR C-terminal-related transcriptional regulator [Dietzia cercidiphylli]MCT1515825.1 LuxR C-terminal-related transcriptional regulator [Dietzia cercidiphylli]